MVGLLLLLECCFGWLGQLLHHGHLVNGIVLLHHEASEFSNFVVRFLDIVRNWCCCVLELGKIFLVVFVDVCDEL